MEKVINIDLEKLKKSQVNKIKNCVIEIINKNSSYYQDKKYAKRLLDVNNNVIEYIEVSKKE